MLPVYGQDTPFMSASMNSESSRGRSIMTDHAHIGQHGHSIYGWKCFSFHFLPLPLTCGRLCFITRVFSTVLFFMEAVVMEKREIEFTTRLTREDVAGLIEALIEGLKDGKLKVKKSDDVLELDVPRVVDLEIEASIDDERAEFEIEVSWRTNRAENPDLPLSAKEDKPAGQQKVKGAQKKTATASPIKEAKQPATDKKEEKSASKSKKPVVSKKASAVEEKKKNSSDASKSKAKPTKKAT